MNEKIKENLIIERASKEDMKVVAEIIRSSASWYEPFLSKKDMKEHDVDDTWIEENYSKRQFFVGKNNEGEIMGTISLQFFGKQTYFGYIYVHADHTGKGIGPELMKFGRYQSIKQGQESLILLAHPKAHWATKAYERFGFEVKHKDREDVLEYKSGLLDTYYEEGFHLYEYDLEQEGHDEVSMLPGFMKQRSSNEQSRRTRV